MSEVFSDLNNSVILTCDKRQEALAQVKSSSKLMCQQGRGNFMHTRLTLCSSVHEQQVFDTDLLKQAWVQA